MTQVEADPQVVAIGLIFFSRLLQPRRGLSPCNEHGRVQPHRSLQ